MKISKGIFTFSLLVTTSMAGVGGLGVQNLKLSSFKLDFSPLKKLQKNIHLNLPSFPSQGSFQVYKVTSTHLEKEVQMIQSNIEETLQKEKGKWIKKEVLPKSAPEKKIVYNNDIVDLTQINAHYGFKVKLPNSPNWLTSYDPKAMEFRREGKLLAQNEQEETSLTKNELVAEGRPSEDNFRNDEEGVIEDVVNAIRAKSQDLNNQSDEMVFIDYSRENNFEEDKTSLSEVKSSDENPVEKLDNQEKVNSSVQEIGQPVKENPFQKNPVVLSESVKKAISRRLAETKVQRKKTPKLRAEVRPQERKRKESPLTKAIESLVNNPAPAPTPSSGVIPGSGNSTTDNNDYSMSFIGKDPATLNIRAFGAEIGKGDSGVLHNYAFVPSHNSGERVSDDFDGQISQTFMLNTQKSSLSGALIKGNYRKMRVHFPLKSGKETLNIPMLEDEAFEKFLNKKKLEAEGGFLLVDLPNDIAEVKIDSNYEAKIYLDDNFKETEIDNSRYLLFVGVEEGRTLATYYSETGILGEKILFIGNEEVTLDYALLQERGLEEFSLLERGLGGIRLAELQLDTDEVSFFNRPDVKMRNIGLNRYEYSRPTHPVEMRKYLEFKHLSESIFLGMGNDQKAELPSQKFFDYVLDELFDMDSLKDSGRCLIQVNLSKAPFQFLAEGESYKGPIPLEFLTLEKDGKVGSIDDQMDDLTEKIYILGQGQGVVNFNVKYMDGTQDFVRTFCSKDMFLIEQL